MDARREREEFLQQRKELQDQLEQHKVLMGPISLVIAPKVLIKKKRSLVDNILLERAGVYNLLTRQFKTQVARFKDDFQVYTICMSGEILYVQVCSRVK